MVTEELPVKETSRSGGKKPSKLWYLVPFFFGILGGIAGYLLVKDRDKEFAKRLMIVGIVMTVVTVLVLPMILIMAWYLMYYMGVFAPKSPILPCSPCFSNFTFVDYGSGELDLVNGPKDINITDVSCQGSSCQVSSNLVSANSRFKISNISQTLNSVKINIIYNYVGSSATMIDTATIHN